MPEDCMIYYLAVFSLLPQRVQEHVVVSKQLSNLVFVNFLRSVVVRIVVVVLWLVVVVPRPMPRYRARLASPMPWIIFVDFFQSFGVKVFLSFLSLLDSVVGVVLCQFCLDACSACFTVVSFRSNLCLGMYASWAPLCEAVFIEISPLQVCASGDYVRTSSSLALCCACRFVK